MSRRDSDSRHHRSRFDRESSPKRSRRDGKPATERPASTLNLDSDEHFDREQKHHRRLQNSRPLEAPLVPDSKAETVPLNKESDKRSNGYREGTKHSSENIEAPRSRSLYQHDERGSAAQVGRSVRHRETTEREWWKDSKDRQNGRGANRSSNNDDTKARNEKRQDSSYKMELDTKPSTKKRPSFRETKLPADVETNDKPATEATKPNHMEHPPPKPTEKPPVNRSTGERDSHRSDLQRMNFQSRDKYGGGSFRGRDRFNNGRQGHHGSGSGGRVEKWKHDLYDEANKSPTKKNEEEQIAKVEALLAS